MSELSLTTPTLSRITSVKRIPPHERTRAESVCPSVCWVIAPLPTPEAISQALDFATEPGPDGRKPSRDEVAAFCARLKNGDKPNAGKAKTVTRKLNGRSVTLTLGDKDTAYSVSEDLKALAKQLSMHTNVEPRGWPFLFQ
jgi:hypothetical protein